MRYRQLKEFYNAELSELQTAGLYNDDRLDAFVRKYRDLISIYKKKHPFKFLLIKINQRFGNIF